MENYNVYNGNVADVEVIMSLDHVNGHGHAPNGHQGYPMAPLPSAPGTTVIVNQMAAKPSSYMALAIIVCLCCNVVFGIIAMIMSAYSSSAADEGDMEGARVKGKISLGLSLAGIAITVISIVVVVVVLVVMVDDAIDDANQWYNGS